jgi:hypothetical protein
MSSTLGAEEPRVSTQLLANLNGSASYPGWGWLSMSEPNLIVILVIILSLCLGHRASVPEGPAHQMTTTRLARAVEHRQSLHVAPGLDVEASAIHLPDRQELVLASWIYVVGVLTLAAFLAILLSGLVLSFAGPATTRRACREPSAALIFVSRLDRNGRSTHAGTSSASPRCRPYRSTVSDEHEGKGVTMERTATWLGHRSPWVPRGPQVAPSPLTERSLS